MTNFTTAIFSPDSTLGDLPSIESRINPGTTGEQVMKLFRDDPENPGVIIMDNASILGLISREAFFETTGKRFGVEVFLGRPISTMLPPDSPFPLILSEQTKISLAIHEALKRASRSVYDPIIVEKNGGNFQVIDILTIFHAENQILLALHNQHVFSVASGLALSDEDAVKRFLKFTGIKQLSDPMILLTRHAVTCDRCGKNVEYSISDVVRSHPMLSAGIEIVEKMGSRSYILYVRHTCGKEIREIPVYHDMNLNLRSLRPSRLVETYV